MASSTHGRPTAPNRTAWYADGLRFECQPDCGACCVSRGAHTHVYLEEADVDRLAAHLQLSRRQFLARHTTRDDGHRVLRLDAPACPFLDGTRCSVHPARPRQCRTYPFWPENVRLRSTWQRTARFCPGVGRGRVHALATIRRHLAAHGD